MHLSYEEIEQRVFALEKKRYQAVHLSQNEESLHIHMDIRKDLGFDSTMLVVLQVDIEDEFHIRFNPLEEDIRSIFTTINNISTYVQMRLGKDICI